MTRRAWARFDAAMAALQATLGLAALAALIMFAR